MLPFPRNECATVVLFMCEALGRNAKLGSFTQLKSVSSSWAIDCPLRLSGL